MSEEVVNPHKLIIGFSQTKREINGPFQMCGNASWLRQIGAQLLRATDEQFAYGWVDINIEMDRGPMTNNKPIGWD